MKTISIVIPAQNERDGIEQTIRAIPKEALERMDYEVQILVVDNDSNDGTGELARNILSKLRLTSNTPLSQELKIEACHFAKCRWREILIRYQPRTGKAKLGGWKVGTTNLLHLFKKRLVR